MELNLFYVILSSRCSSTLSIIIRATLIFSSTDSSTYFSAIDELFHVFWRSNTEKSAPAFASKVANV